MSHRHGIVATGSVSEFFMEVVGEAIKARRVEATDGATSYLVCLLSDYAKPDVRAEEPLERPLSFLLDEALHTVEPGARFDRLRALGDGVLYACGFFGEHFEARGVATGYVMGIGTTAYGAASSMLRLPKADGASAPGAARSTPAATPAIDIYGELSSKFPDFVEVLSEVADATTAANVASAANAKQVLKLYERWLKTGSDRLAQALGAHGLVPGRGGAGKGVLQ
ncbi:MAG: hypothetical protein ACLQVI_39380 [Polyangiaceae bacterium]|jgi:hypothetical protein